MYVCLFCVWVFVPGLGHFLIRELFDIWNLRLYSLDVMSHNVIEDWRGVPEDNNLIFWHWFLSYDFVTSLWKLRISQILLKIINWDAKFVRISLFQKFFANFEIDGISTSWLKFETFTAVGYALLYDSIQQVPIHVTALSKAWVWGPSLAGIAVSNPAKGIDVYLLCVLCVVTWSLRRADRSSRGVLPSVVCLSMIAEPQHWEGVSPVRLSSCVGEKKSAGGYYIYHLVNNMSVKRAESMFNVERGETAFFRVYTQKTWPVACMISVHFYSQFTRCSSLQKCFNRPVFRRTRFGIVI